MSDLGLLTAAVLDAAPAAASGFGGGATIALYVVALIAMFYFLLYRPQQREKKKMQTLMSSIEVGDSICTTGGFYGVIIDITDDCVIIEFGNNKNCRIPMKKAAIAEVEKAQK